MPRISKKVRIRAEKVAHLLRVRGCVLTRDVAAMGYTHKQAEYTLRHLGAAHVKLGQLMLWCYDADTAVRYINTLRRTLHAALCEAGVKYATLRKALKILTRHKAAAKIFSRCISLDPKDTAVKHFISGLLTLTYGDPVYHRRRPIHVVDCNRKRLPPLRLQFRAQR